MSNKRPKWPPFVGEVSSTDIPKHYGCVLLIKDLISDMKYGIQDIEANCNLLVGDSVVRGGKYNVVKFLPMGYCHMETIEKFDTFREAKAFLQMMMWSSEDDSFARDRFMILDWQIGEINCKIRSMDKKLDRILASLNK